MFRLAHGQPGAEVLAVHHADLEPHLAVMDTVRLRVGEYWLVGTPATSALTSFCEMASSPNPNLEWRTR